MRYLKTSKYNFITFYEVESDYGINFSYNFWKERLPTVLHSSYASKDTEYQYGIWMATFFKRWDFYIYKNILLKKELRALIWVRHAGRHRCMCSFLCMLWILNLVFISFFLGWLNQITFKVFFFLVQRADERVINPNAENHFSTSCKLQVKTFIFT